MPNKKNVNIINLTGDQISALLHALEELDNTEIGILGSPTVVHKAYRPEITKEPEEIQENIAQEIINLIRSSANE